MSAEELENEELLKELKQSMEKKLSKEDLEKDLLYFHKDFDGNSLMFPPKPQYIRGINLLKVVAVDQLWALIDGRKEMERLEKLEVKKVRSYVA